MAAPSGTGSCNMWKFASRRCRDTFERGVNCFDKRSAAGITNPPTSSNESQESSHSTPCAWFRSKKCWGSFQSSNNNNTNKKKWNFDHLNGTWLGAITWSSAFVIGWYTSQVIHLRYKYCRNDHKCALPSIAQALKPFVNIVGFKNPTALSQKPYTDNPISNIVPSVYLIANDQSNGNNVKKSSGSDSSSSAKTDSSEGALGEVLNSIENRLGLAAIESGQHKEGLNLLRSAANRNHAPALFNLGLCYEMGLGVNTDEKVAMELYRSAAALEHAGALYNLGVYYGQARGGLARDERTAARLLRLAAVKGNLQAVEALKSLEAEPEPEPEPAPTHSALFIGHVNVLMAQM